jgi:hypothetical protein
VPSAYLRRRLMYVRAIEMARWPYVMCVNASSRSAAVTVSSESTPPTHAAGELGQTEQNFSERVIGRARRR